MARVFAPKRTLMTTSQQLVAHVAAPYLIMRDPVIKQQLVKSVERASGTVWKTYTWHGKAH